VTRLPKFWYRHAAKTGVTTFGPLSSAAVIGDGSFLTDSDTSVRQPFKSKHYIWKCTIDGHADEFPLKFSTLIDNGAHMVLIRPETVKKLGLPALLLPQPEIIDVAVSSSSSTKKALTHYIKFKATSYDGLWTSKTVYAIITPGLCMPIVFGLPFLEFNEIIVDHSLRSCIHKKSCYNLINSASPPPPKTVKPKLHDQLKINRRYKANALKELISTFDYKWWTRLQPNETIKPLDNLKAVWHHICSLINEEVLKRKHDKLMKEFPAVFEPIPHFNKLPTDVVAEIKLIDPNKTIKLRNYPCPRKYKDVWHTLIQQHLKNGIIPHYSSPFASPAFIIPKADPTVLPRWVNDYRQLNENTVPDSHPIPSGKT
jgi:Aspartyl protease